MLKHILAAIVITAGMALSNLGEAQADSVYGNNSNPWVVEHNHQGDHNNEYVHAAPSRKVVVDRKIRRRVANKTLKIHRLLDLKHSYKGYRVKKVMLKIKPRRSHGRIKLLVNGKVTDVERIDDEKWITLHSEIEQPEVWKLEFDVISHPGIPI